MHLFQSAMNRSVQMEEMGRKIRFPSLESRPVDSHNDLRKLTHHERHYAIQGLLRSAQGATRRHGGGHKKAFRKLAHKHPPDVSKEEDAEVRMKEVNEAYTALSDPENTDAGTDRGHA